MSRSKDDERRQALRYNMVELCENVDPEQLLPHLPCLSESAKQRIKCELRNNGQYSANQLLFQELPRKDDWFEQLINAFQHASVAQYSLADKLQSTEDQSIVQKCKPRHNSSTLRTTPERNKIKAKPEPLSKQSRILDLPYSVLSAMKLLDCDGCWKEFAAAIVYNFEDVMKFESNAKDNSYTEIVMRDWSKKHNPRLQDLIDILVGMERWDVIHKLKNISELQHIPFPEQNNKITRTSTSEIEGMPLPVSDCIHDDMEKDPKEEAKVVQLQTQTDKDSKLSLQTNLQPTDEYITGINVTNATLSSQISPIQTSPNHTSKTFNSTQTQDSAEQIWTPLLIDRAETVQSNCPEHPKVTQERSMSEPRQICIAASPVPNDIKMNFQKQIHEEIDKPRLILGGTCPTSLESGRNIGEVPPNTGNESVIDDRLKGPQLSIEIDGCERSPSSSTYTNVENNVLSDEQTVHPRANCHTFGHIASGDSQISYCKNEPLDQIGLERENGKQMNRTVSNGTSLVASSITSLDAEEENQRPDSLLLGATSPYTTPATMSSEELEVDGVRDRDSQDRSSNRLMESLPIIVGAGAVIALMFSLSR